MDSGMAGNGDQQAIAGALRRAVLLVRRDRVARAFSAVSPPAVGVLVVWMGLCLLFPSAWVFAPWLAGILTAGIAGYAGWSALRPVGESEAAATVDRELGLPQSTISTSELRHTELRPVWREAQEADTARRITGSGGSIQWRPARRLLVVVPAFVLLAALAAILGLRHEPAAQPSPQAMAPPAALMEIFEDWEQAQERFSNPLLDELLESIEPLRLSLEDNELSERELLIELGRLEDRITAMREQLERESLAPFAAEMADALTQAGGMDVLTAAVQERNFERAAQMTDALDERFGDDRAGLPQGLGEQSTQERFAELAGKLDGAGHQQAADSMRKFSDAGRNMSREELREALSAMGEAMRQQAARDNQRDMLDTQRTQLALCKDGMQGETGDGAMAMMPSLAGDEGDDQQPMAGTHTDPDRFGAARDGITPAAQEVLTGQADPHGESDTVRFLSQDAPAEGTVSRDAETIARYERLSRQAVGDESMPMAHRLTIRSYFESIRPATGAATDP